MRARKLTICRLTRVMMTRMLERLGHKVITAEHGKDGLEKINAAYRLESDSPAVDVVFLDKWVSQHSHHLTKPGALSTELTTQSNAIHVWRRGIPSGPRHRKPSLHYRMYRQRSKRGSRGIPRSGCRQGIDETDQAGRDPRSDRIGQKEGGRGERTERV